MESMMLAEWAFAESAWGERIEICEVRFFFQAEDGIRDLTVTGVQTCALPIFRATAAGGIRAAPRTPTSAPGTSTRPRASAARAGWSRETGRTRPTTTARPAKIGRGAGRERV